jgi:hypothetical protein
MQHFGRLFQIRKNRRVGIRIAIFEEVFVKRVCDLWTAAIIHSPEIKVKF